MVQPGCVHRPIKLYLRTNADIKNVKIVNHHRVASARKILLNIIIFNDMIK